MVTVFSFWQNFNSPLFYQGGIVKVLSSCDAIFSLPDVFILAIFVFAALMWQVFTLLVPATLLSLTSSSNWLFLVEARLFVCPFFRSDSSLFEFHPLYDEPGWLVALPRAPLLLLKREVLGPDLLTVFPIFSGCVTTVTITWLPLILGISIFCVVEVLQLLNLQNFRCLLVIIHANSAIWYEPIVALSSWLILADSKAATRSDVLIGAPGELHDVKNFDFRLS